MGRVISTCIQFIDAFSNPSNKTIANMRKMAMEAKKAGRSIQGAGNTIQNAGKSLTKAVTAPIAGVGVAAVKTAADYESAMSNVKAITGATGKDFDSLRNLGKDLGKSTAWSAKECAEAMQYTGMAGWTAKDNVDGLKGILDLASASGTDLARTSDIMTDAISAFGYKASDSATFADTMTKACTSANVSVETLGESYKYCGAISGTMKYSIDEVTTSLAVMGNMGIKGSQAGTALKNAISNMAAPTKNMKSAMDKLHISITNQDGSMKSWGGVIKNLQSSFKGLSEKQQAAYAKQLFGKESMAGMLAIINTSTKDYNKLAGAIKNSGGDADKAAKTQLNNLNGQITKLKGALEGAAIAIGERMLPNIREAVKLVQKATDWFNSLSKAQLDSIMKWAGIAATVGPCLITFGRVVTGIGNMVDGFGKISSSITNAGSVLKLLKSPAVIVVGVLAAIAAAAVLVVKNWDKIKPMVTKVKAWFSGAFGASTKGIMAGFQKIFVNVMEGIKAIMPSVQKVFASAMEGIKAVMPIIAGAVKKVGEKVVPAVKAAVSALKTLLPPAFETIKTAIKAAVPVVKTIIHSIGKLLPAGFKAAKTVIKSLAPIFHTIADVIFEVVPIIAETLGSVLKELKPVIIILGNAVKSVVPIIGNALSSAFSFLGGVISDVMPSIIKIASAIGGVLSTALSAIKEAFVKVIPAIKAVANAIGGVLSAIFNFMMNAFIKAMPVLEKVAGVIGDLLTKAVTFMGNAIAKVMPVINKVAKIAGGVLVSAIKRTSFIVKTLASAFSTAFVAIYGVASGIAKKLQPVFSLIGSIIKVVMGVVRKRFVDTFKTAASAVSLAASGIKSVINGMKKAFSGIMDFITGVFTGNWKKAWEGVKNVFSGIFEGLEGVLKVPINAVIGLINKAISGINKISVDIPEGVPGVGGKHIGFSIPTIPALAKGTQDWRGGIVQVGEKGGEIVDLPKGSRVYPHDQSVQMARKSADGKLAAADRKAARLEKSAADRKRAGDITINIPKLAEQIIVRDERDIERIAEEIARKLRDTAINMGTA